MENPSVSQGVAVSVALLAAAGHAVLSWRVGVGVGGAPHAGRSLLQEASSPELDREHADLFEVMDTVFLLVCTFLVMFMQVGFVLIEVGFVTSKNSKNVLIKSFLDRAVGAVVWYIIGYPLAYGGGAGSTWGLGTASFAQVGVPDRHWLFRMSFTTISATILSGGMTERCTVISYLVLTSWMSGFVQPLVTHWMWSGKAWLGSGELGGIMVEDFAGSGVVFMVGGVAALVACLLLGPRIDAVSEDGSRIFIPPHNLVISAIGSAIVMFGHLGLVCGGVPTLAGGGAEAVVTVAINTALASSAGAISAYLALAATEGHYRIRPTLNGMLVGAIAVSAGADSMEPWAAILTGLLSGVWYTFLVAVEWRYRLDDPLDAFAVHAGGGLFGLLARGLFSNGRGPSALAAGGRQGVVYGGFELLGHQVFGAAVIVVWVTVATYVLFWITQVLIGFRAPPEDERKGLDYAMHGGSAYPDFTIVPKGPPSREVVFVVTDVEGSTDLWTELPHVMDEATTIHDNLTRQLCEECFGYEVMTEGDSFQMVFHTAADAVNFAMQLQIELLKASWPRELLAHEKAKTVVDSQGTTVFRGLRVRMAMDAGYARQSTHRTTGRNTYVGVCVQTAIELGHAVKNGGQVIITERVFSDLALDYVNNQRHEGLLNSITVVDHGQHSLNDVLDELGNVQLFQVSPIALGLRDITVPETTKQISKSVADAPGMRLYSGGVALADSPFPEVTLVFVFVNKMADIMSSLPELGEECLARINTKVREVLEICDGYECQEDTGSFFCAFKETASAVDFASKLHLALVQDVEWPADLTSLPLFNTQRGPNGVPYSCGLSVSVGVHVGQPTDVRPHSSTGRADYFGPVVNQSARIAALAPAGLTYLSDTAAMGIIKELTYQELPEIPYVIGDTGATAPSENMKGVMYMVGTFKLKGFKGDKKRVFAFIPEDLEPRQQWMFSANRKDDQELKRVLKAANRSGSIAPHMDRTRSSNSISGRDMGRSSTASGRSSLASGGGLMGNSEGNASASPFHPSRGRSSMNTNLFHRSRGSTYDIDGRLSNNSGEGTPKALHRMSSVFSTLTRRVSDLGSAGVATLRRTRSLESRESKPVPIMQVHEEGDESRKSQVDVDVPHTSITIPPSPLPPYAAGADGLSPGPENPGSRNFVNVAPPSPHKARPGRSSGHGDGRASGGHGQGPGPGPAPPNMITGASPLEGRFVPLPDLSGRQKSMNNLGDAPENPREFRRSVTMGRVSGGLMLPVPSLVPAGSSVERSHVDSSGASGRRGSYDAAPSATGSLVKPGTLLYKHRRNMSQLNLKQPGARPGKMSIGGRSSGGSSSSRVHSPEMVLSPVDPEGEGGAGALIAEWLETGDLGEFDGGHGRGTIEDILDMQEDHMSAEDVEPEVVTENNMQVLYQGLRSASQTDDIEEQTFGPSSRGSNASLPLVRMSDETEAGAGARRGQK